MSTVRTWLVSAASVIAARWTQFVAGRRRLEGWLSPIMGTRLATLPARPVSTEDHRPGDRWRPIHFPQRGRGDLNVGELAEPGTAEFSRFVASARRRRQVVLRPEATRSPWAADAIAALGAAGAPLGWAGRPADLPADLGDDLGAAIAAGVGRSRHARELHSIRGRRSAMHLLDRRAGCADPPGVSVLLATKRPADIERAVGLVARQRGVRVQLLVGLHGSEWSDGTSRRLEALGPSDTTVQRFGAEQPFGDVLAALTGHARHALVAKWDDDDWYGIDHLGDLCLAYRYSGADVVGKAAEFVYLEGSDLTIRRFAYGAESYSRTLAGGTLLTSTGWLERVGGWRPVARGVDRELLDATRRLGGTAYRTHGFQYVLRRRGGDVHTWAEPDRRFRSVATERRPGLDLAFADVEAPTS
ncbi:MAG: hypothetical protein R8G01_23355 [Ilumatobacteraceae bacterium]|nr:hypothetical protein [Ilumatobacteraceae bacterium]